MKHKIVIEISEEIDKLLRPYHRSIENMGDGIIVTEEDCILNILESALQHLETHTGSLHKENTFYVVDFFGGDDPSFVTNLDGNVKKFDNRFDAQKEADDCQDGQVITI